MPDGRARFATAQTDLLTALVAGGPTPPGFDPDRLRMAGDILVAKRAHAVGRALPELAHSLGSEYRTEFALYAAGRPRRTGETTLTDATSFGEWATARRVVSTPAQVEVARARLVLRGGRIEVLRRPGLVLLVGRNRLFTVPLLR